MRHARDPPAINSGPSTESSGVMLVKTFIVIAHGPMMVRRVFFWVAWLWSTVRGVFGFNIDFFVSITGSMRRWRRREPACGLFSLMFTVDHFDALMLMVVGA